MKNIFKKIGLISGGLCIAGACVMTIIYGFSVGNFIAVAIGLILISLSLWFRKLPKKWRKMFTILISIGLALFLIITTIVIIRGARDTVNYQEDCVIVLGSGIRGERILYPLQQRLDKCLEYHRINNTVPIVVSGGQGNREDISEAEAMKRYLVAHGIPANQVIMEDKSRNTIQNFRYSKTILDDYFEGKQYTVACITSDYHIFRAESIARNQQLNVNTLSSDIKWNKRPSAYSREFLSILKYWIID